MHTVLRIFNYFVFDIIVAYFVVFIKALIGEGDEDKGKDTNSNDEQDRDEGLRNSKEFVRKSED